MSLDNASTASDTTVATATAATSFGQHFWARGFFVNTVGRDEEAIRAYFRNQEKEDQRLDQLNIWR
jgi:REP element-mobilizing transposase RayT